MLLSFKEKMILKKIYDEKTRTQKVWYDSSMIVYSEMVEDENENVGDLYIVFKNGTKYRYLRVKFEDYVVFVAGGTDASQGKALNKIIKGKYDYEKVGDADLNAIKAELDAKTEDDTKKNATYFISGHRDITEQEFEANYKPILEYLSMDQSIYFIVGDYHGADIMAQNYLLDTLLVDPKRVTVYHMNESPMNVNPNVVNLKGGFKSDDERDEAMTRDSFADIAFVRDIKKISGTAQNILRRHILQTF